MHKQRLFIVVAGAIGVIAAFLPWASADLGPFGSISVSGTDGGDGWILVALCAAAIGLAVSQGDKNNELDAKMKKAVAGLGGVATALMLYEVFDVMSTALVQAGMGLWLGLLAGIGVLAIPFVIKGDGNFEMPNKETIKADLNQDAPASTDATAGKGGDDATT